MTLTALIVCFDRGFGVHRKWGGNIRQTTRAHRLLLKAHRTGGQDMQLALINLMFRGYFEQEKDIGCIDQLSAYAVQAGVFTSRDEVSVLILSLSVKCYR